MSFGLTPDKLIIIAVLAVFLIGPDRLPGYAAQLARLVRSLRTLADGAKDRMREEMGPEFDEVDWTKLDPRQYDPRRIIREALLDDPETVAAKATAAATATAAGAGVSAVADGEKATSATAENSTAENSTVANSTAENSQVENSYVETAYEKRQRRLGKGRPAPYDGEAT